MSDKSYLELIFEGRNKGYGAFFLRNLYSKNLAIALLTSVLSFLTLMLISFDYFKSVSFSQPQENMVKYETFDASLYKAALPNLTPKLSTAKSKPLVEPKKPVVKEEFKPTKKVEIVKDKPEVAKVPVKVQSNNSDNSGISALNSLIKSKKDTLWTVETTNNVVVNNPTEMASPIGGLAEFIKYIQKSIVYPAQAKANNQEGTVYVQFTVDIDGSVTDVHVMKGFGFGCDEEAIRVVKTSPKWKPAMQGGEPVRQVMRVPAKFRLPQ